MTYTVQNNIRLQTLIISHFELSNNPKS